MIEHYLFNVLSRENMLASHQLPVDQRQLYTAGQKSSAVMFFVSVLS